ncbi:COG4315 family predicted lipoprotein [Devosia chinhatensis]|uniref:Lipoprotein n=1 Tax=Devosia chinhatensis TaxID=429727 RepID=A0A0F5FI64_9HYPH|nr:lipoprotein [Devosia chinhatensis]KKB08260.1 lipoprotein [Devosia chinhatensis]
MLIRRLLAGVTALALTLTPAFAADYMGGAVKSTDIGGKMVLTDAEGMTLYTFDKDTQGDGKSVCNGDCAVKWPPLMAAADAADEGDFTVVTRDDGSKMWAYKGWPLYYWYEDMAAGDTKGDGVGGVWHLALE